MFLFSYGLMVVGVLTKGMPALLFQAITLLVWFIVNKRFWKLFAIPHILAIIAAGGVIYGYLLLFSEQADLPAYLKSILIKYT